MAWLVLAGPALSASAQNLAFQELGTFELDFEAPNDLAYADFDRDGNMDVVVSMRGGFDEFDGAGLTILLGDGNGVDRQQQRRQFAFQDGPRRDRGRAAGC